MARLRIRKIRELRWREKEKAWYAPACSVGAAVRLRRKGKSHGLTLKEPATPVGCGAWTRFVYPLDFLKDRPYKKNRQLPDYIIYSQDERIYSSRWSMAGIVPTGITLNSLSYRVTSLCRVSASVKTKKTDSGKRSKMCRRLQSKPGA